MNESILGQGKTLSTVAMLNNFPKRGRVIIDELGQYIKPQILLSKNKRIRKKQLKNYKAIGFGKINLTSENMTFFNPLNRN